MATRILIYEDNDTLRESICSLLLLHDDFEIAGAFSNCINVVEETRQLNPDVVLMDIDLPKMNGIEAVRKLRQLHAKANIIMITVFDDNNHVYDALRAGANGYLLKKYISDKLIQAIHEVQNGGAPMSPAIARLIIQDLHSTQVTKTNYQLTNRETEILSLLSKGNSYKMIAAELSLSIDTVRTHIKRIYDKLHVNSQIEAVSKALNERLVR